MNKKSIILFILFFTIIIGAITIISICINSKEYSNDITFESYFANIEDSNSSNIVENLVVEVTNDIIENVIVENDIVENTLEDNTITEVVPTTTVENDVKPNTDNITTSKNNTITTPPTTTPTTTVTTQTTKEENKTDTKVNIKNNSTQNETITNEKPNTSSTDTFQDTAKKEDTTTNIGNPELAYTTYRKTNTTIVAEVISILQAEIAKDTELVNFGTKAVSANKTDAYNNTTAFTYLLVSDITKGKVAGNYKCFKERVCNVVGAFGTYYVYAEDEYTYDSRGLNPKWSQTLVWIYIKF